MSENVPRLGLAGAGLPAVDKNKASAGVKHVIPSGRLKGIEMVVRMNTSENPHQQAFMERWVDGEFRESIRARLKGERNGDGLDDDSMVRSYAKASQTPEFAAHVLIADLPQPIEVPAEVDSLDGMPESVRGHYTKDGQTYRLKKNRAGTVDYAPDVGTWLVDRYPELGTWALIFARQEDKYLEERVEIEGNA